MRGGCGDEVVGLRGCEERGASRGWERLEREKRLIESTKYGNHSMYWKIRMSANLAFAAEMYYLRFMVQYSKSVPAFIATHRKVFPDLLLFAPFLKQILQSGYKNV
jgi:hypothetical protein